MPKPKVSGTAIDRAVDAAYGNITFKTDAERVAFLFQRYQQLTAPLTAAKKPVRMALKAAVKKKVLSE